MKRRPACIVSSSEYNQGPDAIVAMVTSRRTRIAHPEIGDVVIRDWQDAGPPLPSVVRTGRLLVLEQRLLTRTLGELSRDDLGAVDAGLLAVLGMSSPA
jgi:mRNA-degrading endonuclease toxin of MazEF toxin-antitoxin module